MLLIRKGCFLFIDVLIVLLDEAVCQQLIKPFHSFSALV